MSLGDAEREIQRVADDTRLLERAARAALARKRRVNALPETHRKP
ncbi:MAG: hypothetical protein ACREIT_05365 [Tepidisphaeraceae bacterium]